MQVVRTIVWILLLVALGVFSYANWDPVSVRIWDGLVLDTMLPAIIILSFAIGFVPMWLYHRATRWQLERRVASLESAARTAPVVTPASAPSAASMAQSPTPPPAPAQAPTPEAPAAPPAAETSAPESKAPDA